MYEKGIKYSIEFRGTERIVVSFSFLFLSYSFSSKGNGFPNVFPLQSYEFLIEIRGSSVVIILMTLNLRNFDENYMQGTKILIFMSVS